MRILFGVLNWGLGHATRSSVLIDACLQHGYQVTIASDGAALEFLQKCYPDLQSFSIPSYGVKYSKKRLALSLALQTPRFLKAIQQEKNWLEKWVKENPVDYIISDSRFGLYHGHVPSVLVNHQLHPKWPFLAAFTQKKFVEVQQRFSEVWVCDDERVKLSGVLSESQQFKTKFIGILSRLEKKETPKRDELLVLLSGPQEERERFHQKVATELNNQNIAFKVIGIPNQEEVNPSKLAKEIASAKWVLAKAGYSTIMDLCKLNAPSILMATPGQSEQEYLATRVIDNNWGLAIPESHLSKLSIILESGFGNWPEIAHFAPQNLPNLLLNVRRNTRK